MHHASNESLLRLAPNPTEERIMILPTILVLAATLAPLPQSAPDPTNVVVVGDEQTALNRRLYELVMNPDTTAEQLATVLKEGADPKAMAKSVGIQGSVGVMYHAAVNLRDPRAIEVLLDAGLVPSPYIVDTAIRFNSNFEVVKCIIDANKIAGAENPKLRISKPTILLTTAARSNPNPAVIRFLLASGDHDVNKKDGVFALTPFLLACQYNPSPEVLEALIEAGANVDVQGGSEKNPLPALKLACISNPSLAVIEFLLDIGCDPTAPYPIGSPPYLSAALSGRHPETFKLLVEHGADPNVVFGVDDAISNIVGINKNEGMLAGAIEAGTQLRTLQPDGESILGLAVRNSSIDPLATLLDLGIDPNAGNTRPLSWCAVLTERPEMVELLVDAGADLDHRTTLNSETFSLLTRGSNALMEASFNLTKQAAAVLQAFVDTGIHVNATNDAGTTALMMVASRRTDLGKQTVPMIRVLIEAGADPSRRDRKGRTAREIAEKNPKLQDVDLEAAFAPSGPVG